MGLPLFHSERQSLLCHQCGARGMLNNLFSLYTGVPPGGIEVRKKTELSPSQCWEKRWSADAHVLSALTVEQQQMNHLTLVFPVVLLLFLSPFCNKASFLPFLSDVGTTLSGVYFPRSHPRQHSQWRWNSQASHAEADGPHTNRNMNSK